MLCGLSCRGSMSGFDVRAWCAWCRIVYKLVASKRSGSFLSPVGKHLVVEDPCCSYVRACPGLRISRKKSLASGIGTSLWVSLNCLIVADDSARSIRLVWSLKLSLWCVRVVSWNWIDVIRDSFSKLLEYPWYTHGWRQLRLGISLVNHIMKGPVYLHLVWSGNNSFDDNHDWHPLNSKTGCGDILSFLHQPHGQLSPSI